VNSEENPSWDVTEVVPGVRAVRFATSSTLLGADSATFRPLWDSLLEGVREGDPIILNFRGVCYYSSGFLGSLFSAYKELRRRGGTFIGCELRDDLYDIWFVSGLRQPRDYILNYVATEEEAVEKAKRLINRA
jgi:anti-anti-sigma regulatory factor